MGIVIDIYIPVMKKPALKQVVHKWRKEMSSNAER